MFKNNLLEICGKLQVQDLQMEFSENRLQLDNELSFLSPYFLGAYGENAQSLEKLLVEYFNEHIEWRKRFHPECKPPISTTMQNSEHNHDVYTQLSKELAKLTSKLKRTSPIYSPRNIGNMTSELMLPALLAQLISTFYNPDNNAGEAAEITVEMELSVGNQFAELFGFNTDPKKFPCAWGHLTSGGSDANYESLWNFRAVKYYPIALVTAAKIMDIDFKFENESNKRLSEYSAWELINFSIEKVIDLRHKIFTRVEAELGIASLKEFALQVEKNRLETLGPAQFFAEHIKIHQPVVLVPATAYDFWSKAMRLLGFGCASLIKVPVTQTMRMDCQELARILTKLNQQNIPVLAVIGILGTLEFGTIDPIHSVVRLQKSFSEKGLEFYIHVDASCGGYMKAILQKANGEIRSQKEVRNDFIHFPSESVYNSFAATKEVDSITLAPHSYGYLPQGTGAFVARNREIVKLLNHSEKNLLENNDNLDLLQLNRFILSGTKPGANAAALYVTHKVLPLNADYLGRVVRQSLRCAEYFYEKIKKLADKS